MLNNKIRFAAVIGVCLILLLSLFSCSKKPAEVTKYNVTFEWNNGSEPTVVATESGKAPAVPEIPENFGYRFVGWFTDEGLNNAAPSDLPTVAADIIYYASWESYDYFKVSFESNGGTAVMPIALQKGNTVNSADLVSPEKEGYSFTGWYKNAACTSLFNAEADKPADNMTLYAGWKLNEGMGECIGIVDGKEVARVAFTAGTPVLPTTDDGLSYIWYTTAEFNEVFAGTSVSTSVTLYGIAYTDGLVIENGAVVAYNGTAQNVIVPHMWNGVEVKTVSDSAFKDNTSIKSVTLPDSIKTVGKSAFYGCTSLASVNLTDNCTSIGSFVFYNCNKLKTVGDISSLTEIPESSFLGCNRLSKITFSDNLRIIGNYAFSDCIAIDAIQLPDSVTSIGEFAFSGCVAVKEFHIPRGLVILGTGAFNGCSALQTLSYSDNNSTAPYRVIDGNLYENGKKLIIYVQGSKTETSFSLPAGANSVAAYAFSGNKNLTELTFDSTGITLEKASLAGMESLEKLSLYSLNETSGYLAYYFGAESGKANGSAGVYGPASLKTVSLKVVPEIIPEYAFFGFSGLTEFKAGNGSGFSKLRKIGQYAFAYTALESVEIPVSLSAIDENAFYGCASIESFTVAEGNPAFGAYDGCLYNKALTTLYLVPLVKTEISFPNTLKIIASGAFYHSNIRTLTIPSSVVTIEFGALSGLIRVEELTVPFIGSSASSTEENNYMIYVFGGTVQTTLEADGTFSYSTGNTYCTPPSLKKLTISEAISKIPKFAFAYLSDVTEIVYTGDVTEIGDYAYSGSGLVELTVPGTVKKIGSYAFASMGDLERATIPGSVGENLGEAIFYNTSVLEEVVFEEGVKLIPKNAFYPAGSRDSETNELNYYSNLVSVTLPASLEVIDENAFAYVGTRYIGTIGSTFANIKFVLPENNNLKIVKTGAFYRSSIASITLSADLTEIEKLAFFGCEKLSTVTFGTATNHSKLEKIGGAAFAMCIGMRKMTIYKDVTTAADLPQIELFETEDNKTYNIFYGASVPSVYVYGANSYRNAKNWDEYSIRIFEIESN